MGVKVNREIGFFRSCSPHYEDHLLLVELFIVDEGIDFIYTQKKLVYNSEFIKPDTKKSCKSKASK